MKFSALTSLVLLATSQAFASGSGPQIIPGGPIKLDHSQMNVLNTILGHADLLDDLAKYGNVVMDIQFRNISRNMQTRVYVGTCSFDPMHICTPKAVLVIDKGSIMPGDATYNKAHLETSDLYLNTSNDGSALSRLLQALMLNSRDTDEFTKAGNEVVQASLQFISPYFSRFQLTIERCIISRGQRLCLGGALLTMEATTKMNGAEPVTTYENHITYLR